MVDEDCVKIAAYFDERQRSGGRLVSEVLLDVYEQHRIAASIVLRGIGGFGASRHLRSDRSLSLSEDPPVAVLAVDTRAAIEKLLAPLRAIAKSAVITLERARLLTGAAVQGSVEVSDQSDQAVKLTVYLGRKERVGGVPAYLVLCDLFRSRGLSGASVLLGVDGTAHGHRQRARFFGGNADVPMMVVAVGSAERAAAVIPELGGLLDRPLITVERVRVCKRDGELLHRPPVVPPTDEHGLALWQKLTVYTAQSDHHDGVPIHRAVIQQLRQRQSPNGATVLRGIRGFDGDREPFGDKLFGLTRRVPVITIVADAPENITESFDVIDGLTSRHGLVTSEIVPALVSVHGDARHGGTDLARYRY